MTFLSFLGSLDLIFVPSSPAVGRPLEEGASAGWNSAGNHGFFPKIEGGPVTCPLNQSNDTNHLRNKKPKTEEILEYARPRYTKTLQPGTIWMFSPTLKSKKSVFLDASRASLDCYQWVGNLGRFANWGPQTMASRISRRICAQNLGHWWWAVTGWVPMVTEWAPKNGGSMGVQNPEMTPTTITHHVFESCLDTMAWTTSGAGQTYGRFKGWRSRAQSNKWVI